MKLVKIKPVFSILHNQSVPYFSFDIRMKVAVWCYQLTTKLGSPLTLQKGAIGMTKLMLVYCSVLPGYVQPAHKANMYKLNLLQTFFICILA